MRPSGAPWKSTAGKFSVRWAWKNETTGGASTKDLGVPSDLDRLHADLEATYGGDAGETAAYRQQAAELIRFFGLNEADKVVATARHVECTVNMWVTHKDYAPKGTLEVSYHRQEKSGGACGLAELAASSAGGHQHALGDQPLRAVVRMECHAVSLARRFSTEAVCVEEVLGARVRNDVAVALGGIVELHASFHTRIRAEHRL